MSAIRVAGAYWSSGVISQKKATLLRGCMGLAVPTIVEEVFEHLKSRIVPVLIADDQRIHAVRAGYFRATVRAKGQPQRYKLFFTLAEAKEWVQRTRLEMHGEFVNEKI